jgi:hypothetical protein
MTYQLRLAGTVGSQLSYLGLPLDAHGMVYWLAALAVFFLGLAAWRAVAFRVQR